LRARSAWLNLGSEDRRIGLAGLEIEMSVAAFTPNDDADAEALRRAQRAHEPSMEEILASIRAIIAEDREPPAAKPGPQIVYSSDAPLKAVTLEPEPEPEPALAGQAVLWAREEEAPPSEPAPEAPAPTLATEPPLLSQETESAVADSFAELAESLSEHAMRVAGGMAREMLRPLLKQWLDENLPAMVERLVRVEIERLARGKR